MLYLYKKTHNITGLQYLGKTKKDPKKYKGSGIVWRNHCKKYGYDVTTQVLCICYTDREIKYWGSYFSKKWNIVESSDWANLKPEEGDGGYMGASAQAKQAEKLKGHKSWLVAHTDESKQKISATQKLTLQQKTSEEIANRMKNSCCRPDTYTIERSAKISKALSNLPKSKKHKHATSISRKAYCKKMKDQGIIINAHNSGKKWFNDGHKTRMFIPGTEPAGFELGRKA